MFIINNMIKLALCMLNQYYVIEWSGASWKLGQSLKFCYYKCCLNMRPALKALKTFVSYK